MTSTTGYADLTLDDLYELHRQIGSESRAAHATLMDGATCLVSPLSPDWAYASALCASLNAQADAVYAEITRRELELAGEPLTHVEMVCTDCRKPAEELRIRDGWGRRVTAWQHATHRDALDCPNLGSPVKVMVAAGNESVPRA